LDEGKSKCAGLAQENGFDRLVKGIAKAAHNEEKSKCAGLAQENGFDKLVKGIAKAAHLPDKSVRNVM
jgi:hypothetical protein